MRSVGHVAHMEDMINTYIFIVTEPQIKRLKDKCKDDTVLN